MWLWLHRIIYRPPLFCANCEHYDGDVGCLHEKNKVPVPVKLDPITDNRDFVLARTCMEINANNDCGWYKGASYYI